jgi:hypothetical protein
MKTMNRAGGTCLSDALLHDYTEATAVSRLLFWLAVDVFHCERFAVCERPPFKKKINQY